MTRSINEGEMQLKMASSASISVIVIGDLSLSFSNNLVLVLHDCLCDALKPGCPLTTRQPAE